MLTMDDSSQSSQHWKSLLLHRRKITLNAAKSSCSGRTSKDARNYLQHFGSAQASLNLVVRKQNSQLVEQH